MNVFHSARLKLTGFYLAVLVVFCLLLTFGVRAFTNHELNRGNSVQRGAVQRLLQMYSQEDSSDNLPPPNSQDFVTTQRQQADVTREHLNRDFLIFDLVLLAGGAIVSYWYAGRTLRPIQAAHEQQKRFTSDASHELRTPLASMKLENEVFLRQKSFTDQAARDLIESNLEEVDRLEKLATNLLALNQYEQGNMTHTPVPITDIVDDAITHVRRSKEAANVTFKTTVTPAQVDINRESITELIGILLDNALKYGLNKGIVEIEGHLHGERYIISVRDHGPGISDTDLPHIFERMYRADKARSSKIAGHGIGLSLAKQIAGANEATLKATNAPDGGAIFTLSMR